ncbi:Metallo-dependent phosphatase-like protein [Truncatella angustata]|uniref:Endopolyphosphatase n=1 Tax=Truncatella angustata TaxID=152316 RepID=A0A9P9A1V6_9PEZI|nr:Metallo-dependent phosphatase-like protein [Truncatella angustata]KAH6659986.1 Metallo-dependent phosphatase-like protein [Truncatella angustata]
MELRGILILAAALLPVGVIAAPLEAAWEAEGEAQHAIEFHADTTPEQSTRTSEQQQQQRKLHGRFLHITDFHPDRHYKAHTSTEAGIACHRGKGPAGYYGAETSDCDSPYSLVNATFDWIDEHLKDNIDFVIWTGDSARHDADESNTRSEKDVIRSNRIIADKFASTLSDKTGLAIPVIPTFGNNDILPHNIMVGGPSKWLKRYTDIWKHFIPESQRHTFELGGWFYTEVVPNKLAVFSLNTLYFFDRNAGVDDCVHPSEPGFKQMEWLRIQLQFLRNRGMKAILMGHVPPARTSTKANWDETCWQKYTLWLQQYRDVVVGSLYGHMNIDHFFLQDTRDINLNYFDTSSEDYSMYEETKKNHDKKSKIHIAEDASQDGFRLQGRADYLTELRSDWAKLPRAALHASSDDDLEAEKKHKKHKKPKKHPLGGEHAERYQLSLVSPSIVPNYFPTLRVFEYNITGLEDSPTWRDAIRDNKPGQGLDLGLDTAAEHILHAEGELSVEGKKKKKGKKGKKPKDPYLIVPEPPSSTALPGPAYSAQPLTLMGYTQYFANLTYLNNDARDFVKDGTNTRTDGWNEGVHKGKKPGHKPHPQPFAFEVEYSTFNDTIYKLKDLTVSNLVKLAYRIGQVNAKSSASFDDPEDAKEMDIQEPETTDFNEYVSDEPADEVDLDIDSDATTESGFSGHDDNIADSDAGEEANAGTESKGKKKKGKGKKKHKKNKVWLHFLRHAFVSTVPDKELKKV